MNIGCFLEASSLVDDSLLSDPLPAVPEWPEFLRGCIRYRQSLDEQLPDAPRSREELSEETAPGHEEEGPERVRELDDR